MERPPGPTIVPGASRNGKQEWNGRFDRGVATKQELPQQPIIATMNGSSVKSSLRHTRLEIKRQPPISAARALKNAMLLNPHVTPRTAGKEKEKENEREKDREKNRELVGKYKDKANEIEKERMGDKDGGEIYKRNDQSERKDGEESKILDTFVIIPTMTTQSFHLSATNTSYLSQLSTNNSNYNSECNTKRLNSNDELKRNILGIDVAVHDEKSETELFDKSGKSEGSSPFRGLKKCRLSSLKIDVSGSIQIVDKDDDDIRKEINEISNLGLIGDKNPAITSRACYKRDGINTSSCSSNIPKPLHRLEIIGRGSSAIIYKSILLKSLKVCAEKVIVVTDSSKRIQMMSELQSLKKIVLGDSKNNVNKCINIIGLLDIVSNPLDGTISICLEYMNGSYVPAVENNFFLFIFFLIFYFNFLFICFFVYFLLFRFVLFCFVLFCSFVS